MADIRYAFVFLVALFALVPHVSSVMLIYPYTANLSSGDTINLGSLGPGQSVSLDIDGRVYTGGIYGEGGYYDLAIVTKKPEGWRFENSRLFGRPLHVVLTAPKDAIEGEYEAEITLKNYLYAEKLDDIVLKVKMRVVHDVMETSINPVQEWVGISQPAVVKIVIRNTGDAADTFTVHVGDASIGDKEYISSVYIPPHEERIITWEGVWDDTETYTFPVVVASTSSPGTIRYATNVTVHVVPRNLVDDYKAISKGILIFPVFGNIIYAFESIIGYLL